MLERPWTSLPQAMFDEMVRQNEAELQAQERERKMRFKAVLEYVGESRSDMFERKYGRLCWQAEATIALRLDVAQGDQVEIVTGIPYRIDARTITLKPHLPETSASWVLEPCVIQLEKILGQSPINLSVKIAREVHPQYLPWASADQKTA